MIIISDAEFQYLLKLEKKLVDIDEIKIGPPPQKWTRKIESLDRTQSFLLDYRRGVLEVARYTWNGRYRQTVIMLRYDSRGMHTNPDGARISGPHFHLYKEGYGTKFAYPPQDYGIDPDADMTDICKQVLGFFSVVQVPNIQATMY